MVLVVKNLSANAEDVKNQVQSLSQGYPLVEGMTQFKDSFKLLNNIHGHTFTEQFIHKNFRK